MNTPGAAAQRGRSPAAAAVVPAVGLAAEAEIDLEHARRFAADTARVAGKIIQRTVRRGFDVASKGSAGDVVTSVDLATERYIVERIQVAFPRHTIVSEEAGVVDAEPGGEAGSAPPGAGAGDGWLWLVDPLDGTNNLAVGLPTYVVGMTLCRGGTPVLGVIHDPVTDQTWSAVTGCGRSGVEGLGAGPASRRRDRRGGLPVLAWTQGYGVRPADATPAAIRLLLESRASRVLQLWAPLLSWAMLARGDIDGFVGYRAGLLDLSGGALIAAEAGLVVTDLAGLPFRHRVGQPGETRDFVAGRPEVVERVLNVLGDLARVEATLRGVWG